MSKGFEAVLNLFPLGYSPTFKHLKSELFLNHINIFRLVISLWGH
jgi:hypothetical protein